MKITSSRFELSAFKPGDEPDAAGPDVVFLGRSNVGKSSLINRLLGTKGLARTSSQPGRTQSINFYRVNESFYFVDLPGYGWAKVPEAVRRSWKPMVEGFLERRRERIALAILVVDCRHDPSELDLGMRDWLEAGSIPYAVVATKWDKLSQSKRGPAQRTLNAAYEDGKGMRGKPPIMTSSTKGTGLRELWRELDELLGHSTVRTG